MTDLTAGGVPVYRDSAGVLRERVEAVSASGSSTSATLLAYKQLTAADLTQAVPLPAIPENATKAVVQSNGGTGVRWLSGGTPTMSVGMRIVPDDVQTFTGDLSALRFIDEGANAVLDIIYYG